MNWVAALLLLWASLSTVAAIGLGKALRLRDESREAAWDNGCQHGLRLAHHTVASHPKPWITYGEERGWEMAREQLRLELAKLIEEDS